MLEVKTSKKRACSLLRQGRMLPDMPADMPAQRARPLVSAFTRRVAELPMIKEVSPMFVGMDQQVKSLT